MEIIQTVVRYGTEDLAFAIIGAIICLILAFLLKKISDRYYYPPMITFFAMCGVALSVFVFPEEVSYEAIITDYAEVQEQGYTIIERIDGDLYHIEKETI